MHKLAVLILFLMSSFLMTPAFTATQKNNTPVAPVFSADDPDFPEISDSGYASRTGFVTHQLTLLKNRITRASADLKWLQDHQNIIQTSAPDGHVTENMLQQSALEVSIAKSDLDSVTLELAESRQTVSRLEKAVEGLKNRLNVVDIFGIRLSRNDSLDIRHLQNDLRNQSTLLTLERKRSEGLITLQEYARSVLQIYQSAYTRLQSQARSEAVL